MKRDISLESSSFGRNIKKRSFASRQDLHLARKLWHFSGGGLGLFLYFIFDSFPVKAIGIFCLVFSITFFGLDILRFRNQKFNKVFCKLFRPILRDSEVSSFAGHSYYLLGVGISMIFFQENIAVLSILFLVFADPLSSLVGGLYGKEKFIKNKSIEGCLTCAVVCYSLAFFYMRSLGIDHEYLLAFCLLSALVGTISELVSGFGIDDNLTIPVISGAAMTLLNSYFNIFI